MTKRLSPRGDIPMLVPTLGAVACVAVIAAGVLFSQYRKAKARYVAAEAAVARLTSQVSSLSDVVRIGNEAESRLTQERDGLTRNLEDALQRCAAVELELREVRGRFSRVVDLDAEVARVRAELSQLVVARDAFDAEDKRRRDELNKKYVLALATYDRLRVEVATLEEDVEAMSFGLYKPHYRFDTSEEFKRELDRVWVKKKRMLKEGTAATCAVKWQVGTSSAEGKRMVLNQLKAMLFAFNGESDAAVARVTWNNVTKMEERIRKTHAAIDKMGSTMQAALSREYVELSIAELRLTHEYELKKQEEKEEQRRIREQMREEEKALREAERAKEEAEAEETRYEKALAKARAEVEKAKGEELNEANAKLAELEQKLAEAHAKMQRATSMAQLTRSGHVYIISNVGSFGEKTFKIGMTRRLEPMDRIQELGDASVPFPFDVHAMIYSEDAPTLESEFHREFEQRRVNLVNPRKEYFNVTIDEVEAFALRRSLSLKLTKLAEAREYRETAALREEAAKPRPLNGDLPPPVSPSGKAFPAQLLT